MFLDYNAKDKTLTGPLLVCNIPHEINGYIYPKAEMIKAVQAYQPRIDEDDAVGVLSLDNSHLVYTSKEPNPERIAASLSNIYFEGDTLMGVFKIWYKTNDGGLLIAMSNAHFKFKASAVFTGFPKDNVVHNITIHFFYIAKI